MTAVGVSVDQLAGVALPAKSGGARVGREDFERALVRAYPGLTTLLFRHTQDRQLAADILQDAIVTTLAKLDDGVITPSPRIAGYVFRAALNHLRNHRRRERLWGGNSEVNDIVASDVASPVDDSQRVANAQLIRRVLQGLGSARDRQVLVRFYLQDHDKLDICAELGISELEFNRVVFRARERLRRLLEQSGMHGSDLLSLLLALGVSMPVGYWSLP